MSEPQQYYWDGTGQKVAINPATNNILAYNDPLAKMQKFQYQGTYNPSTALQREGGFNLFGSNWFGTDKLNLSDLQVNALNSASGGQWGAMSQAQQIQFLKQNPDLMPNLMGAKTNGQAQEIFKVGMSNMNNNQWTTKDTLGAIGVGINAITGLYGIYNAHKQLKLAKQSFEEQRALNRANFKNQARTLNNQYRDQMSGRGHVGMNSQARTALGKAYQDRRLEETY